MDMPCRTEGGRGTHDQEPTGWLADPAPPTSTSCRAWLRYNSRRCDCMVHASRVEADSGKNRATRTSTCLAHLDVWAAGTVHVRA